MKLEEKLLYWIDNAKYDLDTADTMFQAARYAYTWIKQRICFYV